jgi:hypothetical protein
MVDVICVFSDWIAVIFVAGSGRDLNLQKMEPCTDKP